MIEAEKVKTDFESEEIQKIKADIVDILITIQDRIGEYIYFGYIKTSPEAQKTKYTPAGFEEHDCRVILPDLTPNRVRYANDRDEILCKEITDKILNACNLIIEKEKYVRIIVSKNGTINMSIGK